MKHSIANIALSPSQMHVLQGMGMSTGDASMVYRFLPGTAVAVLMVSDSRMMQCAGTGDILSPGILGKDTPAYTSDDILRRLPSCIDRDGYRLSLCVVKCDDIGFEYYEAGYYLSSEELEEMEERGGEDISVTYTAPTMLEALYSLLLWCLDDGCLKSDRQLELEIKDN